MCRKCITQEEYDIKHRKPDKRKDEDYGDQKCHEEMDRRREDESE